MRRVLIATACTLAAVAGAPAPAQAQLRASCSVDPSQCSEVQQRTGRFNEAEARRLDAERRERDVAQVRARQAQRLALAEELDGLLTAGQCDQAVARATAAGHADITAAVIRTCSAPPQAAPTTASPG